MEELRKLEELQRMLNLMHSHGVVSSSRTDSNRFLVNLILLLINPCGDLDINDKCSLIRENIAKISSSFLVEASLLLNPQGPVLVENKITGFTV